MIKFQFSKYYFSAIVHSPICVIGGGTASLNFSA